MPTAEEIRDEYRISEEHFEELREQLGTKSLREQNKTLAAEAKKVPDLEAKVASFETAPKRREKFESNGLDFDQLSPLERRSVESFEDFEDDEKVAAFIEENQLATKQVEGNTGEEPAAGRVAEHAKAASRNAGASKSTVGPDDVAKWSAEKIEQFAQDHPELYDRVMSNEQVVVPAAVG